MWKNAKDLRPRHRLDADKIIALVRFIKDDRFLHHFPPTKTVKDCASSPASPWQKSLAPAPLSSAPLLLTLLSSRFETPRETRSHCHPLGSRPAAG
jgi:hypothetical protein